MESQTFLIKMPSLFGHATELAQSLQGNCQPGESFLLDDLLPAPTNSGTMSDGAVSVPGNLVEDHVLNFLGAGPPASPFYLHAVAEVFSWVVLLMARVGEGPGDRSGEIDAPIV